MDYQLILKLTCGIGYELAMNGAETFRIEESISRILSAYDVKGEAFSVPNMLIVTVEDQDGDPITKMQRISFHGNDLDAVERFSGLSRKICFCKPSPQEAYELLQQEIRSKKTYKPYILLLAHFMAAGGFALLFGGGWWEAFLSGICGIIVGIINGFMGRWKANLFISTISASFLMAFFAYALGATQIVGNPDPVIIGALMLLVPGLLFTNSMRDILYGDTNSGITRLFQVLLIALAISLGTAVAFNASSALFGMPRELGPVKGQFFLTSLGAFLGCTGFSLIFNIHGPGGLLCSLGGVLTWVCYLLGLEAGFSPVLSYFLSTVFCAIYAEIMARVRKYPAISYLVVGLFPLIPGSDVYYTMNYAVRGNTEMFNRHGMFTAAVAGVMAVAILLISTAFRIHTAWRLQRRKK